MAEPLTATGETAHRPNIHEVVMTTPTVRCAGIPITCASPEDAAKLLHQHAHSKLKRGVAVHLCNAWSIALADKEPELHAVFANADINFPDGQAVVWMNRLQHRDQVLPKRRVAGPDLMQAVFARTSATPTRHFLLGSTQEVLDKLAAELRESYPHTEIVGIVSPPFRPATDAEREALVASIKASGAHFVWVGLGTPKQDFEVATLAAMCPAVFVAVGAAFDFIAGTRKRAPEFIQNSGWEWLYRLAQEPKRLRRRYIPGNLEFIWAAVKHRKD